MKAAIRRKYIPSHELKIEEIEKPNLKDDEILVKVFATTVNRTDTAVLTGKPFVMRFFTGLLKPTIITTGTDFAGQVEAVGSQATEFKVGERVFGFNDEGLGSHAEYLAVSTKEAIMKIPEKFSYAEAAASLEGMHYAVNFLNKIEINANQKILLNGATGAIGSVGLQILKYHGCYVTAVCNTKNIDLIKSLGADKIYDYEKEDFAQLDDEKYDFVFDAVGKSSFGKCKPLLKENGIYCSSELGPNAENPFLAIRSKFYGKKKVIFPIPSDIKASIEFNIPLIEQGKFRPIIDRTYPLEKISEAFQYVETGQKTGNVVIEIVK